MAIKASDLIEPKGEIAPNFFPGDDSAGLTQRLRVYLEAGYGQAGAANDDAAKAYAYARAYRAVFLRLSSTPASAEAAGQGSYNMLVTQIKHFEERAIHWEIQYSRSLDVEPKSPVLFPTAGQGAVKNAFTW